jgi:hypothetical protein
MLRPTPTPLKGSGVWRCKADLRGVIWPKTASAFSAALTQLQGLLIKPIGPEQPKRVAPIYTTIPPGPRWLHCKCANRFPNNGLNIVAMLHNQHIRRLVGQTHNLIAFFAKVCKIHRLKACRTFE